MTGAEQEPARPAQVNAQGSQGIQVGGTQYNQWVSRPPDPAALEALSPRAGADYLARQSRDDAAMVLAAVPAELAAETIAALLQSDEPLAISLLTHLNPRKAEGVIAAMPGAAGWLAALPAAAEAMDSCAYAARGRLGEATGPLTRVLAPDGSGGLRRGYDRGVVYWHRDRYGRGPALVVAGQLAAFHASHGGSPGALGFPVTQERPVGPSPFGTAGSWQIFGLDSGPEQAVCCSAHGVFLVRAEHFRSYFEPGGGPDGPLGFPVAAEDSYETRKGQCWRQRFEGGVMYCRDGASGVFRLTVTGDIARYHESQGGPEGWPGCPAAAEQAADESPYGTAGVRQRFAGGTVYTSDAHGTYGIDTAVQDALDQHGGTGGWLGFPVSEDILVMPDEGPGTCLQTFEGGAVFWQGDASVFAVPKATMELFEDPDGIGRQLGLPVSSEQPTADDGARVQFFEHGVVTTRGGLAEAWVRPGPRRDRGWLALGPVAAQASYQQAESLGAAGACLAVVFSPDGTLAGVGTDDGMALLWAHGLGPEPREKGIRTLDGQAGSVRAVAFSPDGTMLAAAGKDLMVRLWDVQQGICALTLPGLEDWAHCCAFSPDGSLIAAGGRDHAVRVWVLPFKRAFKAVLARSFSGTTQRVLAAAFSPDGELLAEGGGGGTVRLWDVRSGTLVSALTGHTGRVQSVAFSPDGRTLASAGDRTVRLWDLRDGAVIRSHSCPEGFATCVAISADGALIATGGTDAAVRLWSAEDGRPCGVLRGHDAAVRSVAFSPAGPLLASASDDRTVLLWEPAS